MTKSSHYFVFALMGILVLLVIFSQGLNIHTQFEKAYQNFLDDVQKAINQTKETYIQLNMHVSNQEDKKTFDTLYINKDSSFVFMIAQTSQKYPLLSFQPDTNLPKLRKKQFLAFKDILEKTRFDKNIHLKEFYLFRSIQYCLDCKEDKMSVSKIFPLENILKEKLQKIGITTQNEIFFYDKIQKNYNKKVDKKYINQFLSYNFTEKEQIHLFFPHLNTFIFLKNTNNIIIPFIFSCISIITFIWATKVLLQQRKLEIMKNDFINNVTHEFKTPLATISFAIANIENQKVLNQPETIKYFTKIIKEENKRLNSQVEKVLQTAITEKDALTFKQEIVDIHQILNELADIYELKIKDKQGIIDRKLNANPALVKGDEFHLSNAFSNLLDNAIKYNQSNTIIITISTENNQNNIEIQIQDNGIGIDNESQKMVFEKFYRVHTGNLHKVKGFGLGLHYTKYVIEKHKGKITLQSKINKGSTFSIFLPFLNIYESNK